MIERTKLDIFEGYGVLGGNNVLTKERTPRIGKEGYYRRVVSIFTSKFGLDFAVIPRLKSQE
jgi:hypothetical protein